MAESTMISDFIKVQKDLPSVKKTAKGNYGKHLDLEEIMPLVLKKLNDNNFALVQAPSTEDGKPALTSSLYHISGGVISETMLLVLDKVTAQGQGSAITYARRYAVCSMLGLVADKDDDGQRAEDETVKAGSSDDLPSESQKTMVKNLMHERGYEGVEAMAVSEQLIGKKIPQTKSEYSQLIDALIKQPKKES